MLKIGGNLHLLKIGKNAVAKIGEYAIYSSR
jgi:hypothetical protein